MIPVSNFGVNFQSRSIGIKFEEGVYRKIQKKHNQDTTGRLILKKFFLR